MRARLRGRTAGLALAGALALTGVTACSDQDQAEVEEQVEEGGQQVEEGAEDAGNEVEEQVDEGAEESDEDD